MTAHHSAHPPELEPEQPDVRRVWVQRNRVELPLDVRDAIEPAEELPGTQLRESRHPREHDPRSGVPALDRIVRDPYQPSVPSRRGMRREVLVEIWLVPDLPVPHRDDGRARVLNLVERPELPAGPIPLNGLAEELLPGASRVLGSHRRRRGGLPRP